MSQSIDDKICSLPQDFSIETVEIETTSEEIDVCTCEEPETNPEILSDFTLDSNDIAEALICHGLSPWVTFPACLLEDASLKKEVDGLNKNSSLEQKERGVRALLVGESEKILTIVHEDAEALHMTMQGTATLPSRERQQLEKRVLVEINRRTNGQPPADVRDVLVIVVAQNARAEGNPNLARLALAVANNDRVMINETLRRLEKETPEFIVSSEAEEEPEVLPIGNRTPNSNIRGEISFHPPSTQGVITTALLQPTPPKTSNVDFDGAEVSLDDFRAFTVVLTPQSLPLLQTFLTKGSIPYIPGQHGVTDDVRATGQMFHNLFATRSELSLPVQIEIQEKLNALLERANELLRYRPEHGIGVTQINFEVEIQEVEEEPDLTPPTRQTPHLKLVMTLIPNSGNDESLTHEVALVPYIPLNVVREFTYTTSSRPISFYGRTGDATTRTVHLKGETSGSDTEEDSGRDRRRKRENDQDSDPEEE